MKCNSIATGTVSPTFSTSDVYAWFFFFINFTMPIKWIEAFICCSKDKRLALVSYISLFYITLCNSYFNFKKNIVDRVLILTNFFFLFMKQYYIQIILYFVMSMEALFKANLKKGRFHHSFILTNKYIKCKTNHLLITWYAYKCNVSEMFSMVGLFSVCERGYHFYNRHCYRFGEFKMTWRKCKVSCFEL